MNSPAAARTPRSSRPTGSPDQPAGREPHRPARDGGRLRADDAGATRCANVSARASASSGESARRSSPSPARRAAAHRAGPPDLAARPATAGACFRTTVTEFRRWTRTRRALRAMVRETIDSSVEHSLGYCAARGPRRHAVGSFRHFLKSCCARPPLKIKPEFRS